jgi:arylsulfatase
MKYRHESEEWGGGGTATLFIDGQPAGEGKVDFVVPLRFSATETMDIGMDLGSAVSIEYADQRPFAFTGKIDKVTIDLVR